MKRGGVFITGSDDLETFSLDGNSDFAPKKFWLITPIYFKESMMQLPARISMKVELLLLLILLQSP